MGNNRAARPIESEKLEDANKDDQSVTPATAADADGYDDDEEGEEFVDELKPGTELFHGQFKIDRFINSGGFGITYLARDSLDRPVVIKECFPGSFCRRSESIVRARSRAHQNEYKSIVRLFVQEAKSLSKLIHPNIVGVHQVFEDNDTAYMAIDFVDGRDLLAIIEDKDASLTPELVTSYLVKLLGAVDFIHTSGVLHRDISPDNILINEENEPILIDFGAAREEASKTSRALSALRVVKDGYSPQEFYISGSLQSDSSDLYALAASFYHAITGFAPPNSQARLAALADDSAVDPYVPLAGQHEGYSEKFLEAIDTAMNVLPRDRIKSAREWLELIDADDTVVAQSSDAGEGDVSEAADEDAVKEDAVEASVAAVASAVEETVAPQIGTGRKAEDAVAAVLKDQPAETKKATAAVAAAAQSAGPAKASRGPGLMISVGAAALIAAGVGYVFLGGSNDGDEGTGTDTEVVASSSSTEAETPESSAPTTEGEGTIVLGETDSGAGSETETATAEVGPVLPENSEPTTPEQAASEETNTEVEAEEVASTEGETATEPQESSSTESENASEGATDTETPAEVEVATNSETETETPSEEVETTPPAELTPPTVVETQVEPTNPVVSTEPVELLDEQFVATTWDITLPFTTEVELTDVGSFPVITSVAPEAQANGQNEWISEGVTIFAVNDEWVQSDADIKTFIEGVTATDDNDFLMASVRIRTENDSGFQHVEMSLPATRVVELANGAVFEIGIEDGNWQTVVQTLPSISGNTLEVGDVILAENTIGFSMQSALSLETLISLMTRRNIPDAVLSVRRDGSRMDAVMPLARK